MNEIIIQTKENESLINIKYKNNSQKQTFYRLMKTFILYKFVIHFKQRIFKSNDYYL